MVNVWFIADTHFGHANVLQYEPIHRPFATIAEHDAILIERWNSVVKPKDIVWHLGDFCLGGAKNVAIAGKLNGDKRLVMGNHDVYQTSEYLKYFTKLYGAIAYKDFVLSHIPQHPQHCRAEVNIHGHLHSKNVMEAVFNQGKIVNYIFDTQYFCVSAEQNNLTPINFDEIKERIIHD